MGFALSFFINIICSYFIVCISKPKNFLTGFLYIALTFFALIVLNTELLSIFNLFNKPTFLFLQLIEIVAIIFIWLKCNKPIFNKSPLPILKKILKNLKMDKALIILALGWLFSLLIALFLAIVFHITRNGDAEVYHVARSYFWVINHSINHFETSQVRMLAFPINSEILYSWVILFFKNAICLGLFSFSAYLVAVSALFGIMDNFSYRRRLWVIFIASSFANIIVQMSSTETDIIIASLILASMYLFKEALKTNSKIPLYFSALSYALAIGTKTTALFLIPAVALYFIYQSKKYLKTQILKPFIIFIGFSTLNFIVFSAYNYILNFLSFGNFLGATNTIELHKNIDGIKGTISSFVKTSFLLFDFTGLPHNELLISLNKFLETKVLTLLSVDQIKNGINSSDNLPLNQTMFDTLMGCGVLGGLLFVPSLLIALIKPIFSWSKNTKEMLIFAIMFILTLITMSSSIVFMTFNNRFLSTFLLVCAPILGLTYLRKKTPFIKWGLTLIAVFYFTVISTHIWTRPFVKICDALLVKKQTLEQINNRIVWMLYDNNTDVATNEQKIINKINTYPDGTKIIIFLNYDTTKCRLAKEKLNGKNIDIQNLETFNQEQLINYDVIIYPVKGQIANVSFKNDFAKNCIYKDKNFRTLAGEAKPCGCQCFIEDKYHTILFNNGYRADFGVYSGDYLEYIFLKKIED